MILWLILLGVFVYFIVRQSVANLTRTPVWLLWLVMMTPAIVFTGWSLASQDEEPLSWPLLIILFGSCFFLYLYLVQAGRIPASQGRSRPQKQSAAAIAAALTTPPPVVRPIDRDEEASLRHCFPWTVYYLQNLEYRPQAVICQGQLRAAPELAYETVRDNIKARFGDRFLVIFQEGLHQKPFFALVPNAQAQKAAGAIARPGLAGLLLIVTLMTTTLMGVVFAGVTEPQLQANPGLLWSGLPYALALLTILGVHELGHYFTARYYRMQATLPYFIPVPLFLGTFGAFIQLKSPIPNRKALFDIGLAGPLAGFVITLPLLLWGLAQSSPTAMPSAEDSSLLNFTAFDPNVSLLILLLSKVAIGSEFTAANALQLHPVAIAGCLGLVVTALNLMPVGQLDGGHIVHAMFGQRIGALIGQVARFLMLGLALLLQREFLWWAILLFLMPAVDEPALNDVSELDNRRDLLGLAAIAILLLIVLPAPTAIQSLFQ